MTTWAAASSWFSSARLQPYLDEADGDETIGMELYKWNAELSGACFEVLGHLEVFLRNAIDTQLSSYFNETTAGIPWFC